ncbi:hypothetical protein LCL61_01725 [Amycolatopsis coloradensis]|uniref:Uncharacterized protein n=1 Tax=Amycolatopsis coloradensis TaxID=76021 RepID=A0ACD5B4I4_9PSEU
MAGNRETAAQRRQKLAVIGPCRPTGQKKKTKAADAHTPADRTDTSKAIPLKRIRTLLDSYCQPPRVQAQRGLNRTALLAELCRLTRQPDAASALRVARDMIQRTRKTTRPASLAAADTRRVNFGERCTRIRSVVVNPVGNGKRR